MFPFLQPAANTEKWDCFSSPQLNNEQFCESTTKDQEARPTFYLIYRARFSAGINWSVSTGVKENMLINTCQSSALHIMFAESMA